MISYQAAHLELRNLDLYINQNCPWIGSGSEYSPGGGSDDEEEVPSDGGGSDYEPDEPVKVGRGAKSKKKVSRRDSDDGSSGEEWGGKKKKGSKGKKKKNSSDEDDSDYEKPKAKKARKGGGNGYTAPVKLTEELADIVGGDEMPRHEVGLKFDWIYWFASQKIQFRFYFLQTEH